MIYDNITIRTYLPGPLKLSILPNTQFEYCQVDYLEKYSTFSTGFLLNKSWACLEVEYLAKFSAWMDQADKSLDTDLLEERKFLFLKNFQYKS